MIYTKTMSVVLATLAVVAASPVAAKAARCTIKSADGGYAGPCAFTPGGKGSFSVTPPAKSSRKLGATVITVERVGRDQAEVRGLTTDGINSRWGTATRSKKDRSCWIGSDFSICAS